MKLSRDVAQGTGISLDNTRLDFGSEVFFYGFPLTNLGTEIPGIKFPLVKKAVISGAIKYKGENITFDENSGIILCYGGNYIRDILKENK
jgi:hypothetical protein